MNIKESLEKIKYEINNAELKSGRNQNSVKLMAVSKFHPIDQIQIAINENQFLFGENRVKEACDKFSLLKEKNQNIELHMIGQLQSNKVKNVVQIANCIQSVDRISLLEEIEKQCSKINKKINILFEIHTGEDSKSGFIDEVSLRNAIDLCAQNMFPHIIPKGFMTMAPFTDDEKLIRKSFTYLRELSEKIKSDYNMFNFSELSMGMSNDYKIAIEEGSTMVRIGTAIFGERTYNK